MANHVDSFTIKRSGDASFRSLLTPHSVQIFGFERFLFLNRTSRTNRVDCKASVLKVRLSLSNITKYNGKAHSLPNALDSSGNLAKLWAEVAFCYQVSVQLFVRTLKNNL